MKKKIMSATLAAVIMAGSGVTTLAAAYDIQHIENLDEKYSFGEFRKTPSITKKVDSAPTKYTLESKDGKRYYVDQVDAELKSGAENFEEAIKDLTPMEEELVVESVSAIDQTVDKEGTLKFKINGEKEVTAEDIKEEGYKVIFKASEAVFENVSATSETGRLAIKEVEKDHKFKYEVEVKDKDGKAVEVIGGFAEVTVEDQTKMVTEITKVEVETGTATGTETRTATKEYNLAKGEKATIKVYGRTKKLKEEDKDIELTSLVKFENTPVTAGSFEGNVFTPDADAFGKVTVKYTAGEKTGELVLNIQNEDRKVDAKASKVSEDKLEIAAGKTAKFTVELVDQFGKPVELGDNKIKIENVKDDAKVVKSSSYKAVEEEGKVVPGKYEVTIIAEGEKAVGEAKIVADGVTLDQKINITVKEAGEATKVDLEASAENFDLFKDDETITITGKALDDKGLEVALEGGKLEVKLELKENDKFTFNKEDGELKIAANATVTTEDKAVVVAKLLEGEITLDTKEITIGVVDTTPEITSAKIKDGKGKITASVDSIDILEYIEVKVTGEKEVKVDNNSIRVDDKEIGKVKLVVKGEDFTLSEGNGLTFPTATEEVQEGQLIVGIYDNNGKIVEELVIELEQAKAEA